MSLNHGHADVNEFMSGLIKRNPGETEFHQAVQEVVETLIPFVKENKKYKDNCILERLTEPDRVVSFRVCWEDDQGKIRVNRGYRVQFSNAIGPYKGGLRFHPSVNLSILKFLGFEQILKNSLTTLPLGGGKGGSDFDPKGKSDREVMRFCQSFMNELVRYVGPNQDVPAGDIGVGAREVGYLFGQYTRLKSRFEGTFTGKGIDFGGSLIRTEATGYGAVYFAQEMLARLGDGAKGKKCLVSGSGNVAQYTVEKLIQLGAKVLTMSDSGGTIYDPDGINQEKLEWVKELKKSRDSRIEEYKKKYPKSEYYAGKTPWHIPCEMAFPCATQNEIHQADAATLVKGGVKLVVEGANMPTTIDGIRVFQQNKVMYSPGKASNAGGVAISGLEMTQNSMRLAWTREEVDEKLSQIMKKIHKTCVTYGLDGKTNHVDYVKGANIGGFVKIADTMISYGLI